MLKPTMRSGWPLKRLDTRLITPGVSILQVIDFINNLLNNEDNNNVDNKNNKYNNNNNNEVGVSLEEDGYPVDHPRAQVCRSSK